jgi:hypothetical protein
MTPDFRALTDEILQLLDYYIPEDDRPTCWDPWRQRARAALLEPEPEGPTVMEIIELADEIEAAELGQVDLVRAALARWGHPTEEGS